MDKNTDLIWVTLESLKNKETLDVINLLQKTLAETQKIDSSSQKDNILKTEKEIRDEIEATNRTIKNYKDAYKKGKIDKEILESQIIDCIATIDALKWVLGENNRYD